MVLTELRRCSNASAPRCSSRRAAATAPAIVELFTALGYKAFTLEHGREIPLTAASAKDIIFRPQ